MVRWIIDSSLKLRWLIVALAAGVIAVGVAQIHMTPVEALPEFKPTIVEVQTEALGLSAKEVEQLITSPLEQDLLAGVAFLDNIESVSLPGLSSVVLTFEPGTDLLDARQVVQERLTQAVGIAGLPAVAKLPQMIQPLASSSRVAMIRLQSEELSPIEVSVLTRFVIGPRLMSTDGVANVVVWGNREQQLQVQVDPQRLRQNNTTLAQVISTAGNALEVSPLSFLEASKPGTGGFIDTPNQRLNIFHEQAINTADELAQVPLEGFQGGVPGLSGPLTLGDVADVVEGHQPLIGDAVCAGGEDCLLLVVEKLPGANLVEVTRGVEDALAALRPGLADIQMDASVYRPASFVESSFENLGLALLVGGLLLLLLLGVIFWEWRRAVLAVVAIGVSAAAALLVLQLRGTTVDFMVVAGLVVGLTVVIADAVTDVTAISSRLGRDPGRQGLSAWQSIVDSVGEMRRTACYALLIMAAAVLPVFFLRAEGEAFLRPIAVSYLLAVTASMVVALTLTPALAALLLSGKRAGPQESPAANRLRTTYDRVAPKLLASTGVALGVGAGLAVVGMAAAPFLNTALRPSLEERDVLVQLEAQPGTSLPKMSDLAGQMAAELRSIPGVAHVGSHVGRAVMSDQTVDVNSGEIWVHLEPAADYDDTVAAVSAAVDVRPGVTTDVLTYSEARVNDILDRSGDDLTVRVYGEDAAILDTKADELMGLIGDVDGVEQANVERVPQEPTLEVQADLEKAQSFGVTPGDVRRTAAILLGSITVGHLFDEQKVFDVVVWASPNVRQRAADIGELTIDTPGGGVAPLASVADIRVVRSPTVIQHESAASYLDVTAAVGDRDVEEVASDVNALVGQVDFPLDHHAELLGGYAEQQADQWRLAAAALGAALAIFLLLHAAFSSWRLAVLAFVSLPLALVGGVVVALLAGGTLTLASLAGLVGILGIAARGVVLLIRRYRSLQLREGMDFGPALVLRGTRDCLLPILGSAVAAALLLAPFAVAGDAVGFDILHPMALVLLGGLLTATVVNLFVVPVLYVHYGYVSREDAWTDDLFESRPTTEPVPQRVPSPVLQRIRAAAPVLPLLLPALLVSSCGGAIEASAYTIEHDPAKAVPIPGTDLARVIVEPRAAERLEIQSEPVEKGSRGRLLVPDEAVYVETDGSWWVYTHPKALEFVREEVAVDRQAGGQTFLTEGPPAGTRVVTVGVAELRGIEEEIGH